MPLFLPTPTGGLNPWKKGPVPRRRPRLWPEAAWKRLVKQADEYQDRYEVFGQLGAISTACLALIREFNATDW